MGRSIFAEDVIERHIQGLFGTQKLQLGLLIGQFADTRDYIVHLAQAPDPVEDEAEVESVEEGILLQDNETENKKTVKKKANEKQKQENLEDFDENWITEHARQVNRMLPGGLSVVGIYIFSAPEFMNKNQNRLRQCLNKVHKYTEKNKFIKAAIPHSDRVLLHICSATKKITCRTLDVRDSQSSLRPAEFKYQSFSQNWHTIQCSTRIQVKAYVLSASEKHRYETQIQLSLQDQLEDIWHSTALINDIVVEDSDHLCMPVKTGKTKKEESKTFDLELFIPCVSRSPRISKEKSIGIVTLLGSMSSRAFVYNKASKGLAAKAIKMDIIRSILSRVELLCEEAEINDLYQVPSWSLISPTRIFAPLHSGPIQLCDYAFKDEKLQDSLDRFADLLNLRLTTEELICDEKTPDDNQSGVRGDETDTRSQTSAESVDVSDEEPRFSKLLGIVLALLILILAVVISVLLPK